MEKVKKETWQEKCVRQGVKYTPYQSPSDLEFWYKGELITKEKHDLLTNEEIRENNDLIRKRKVNG